MLKTFALLLMLLTCARVTAGEVRVSPKETIFVTTPDAWSLGKSKPPAGFSQFETYSLTPSSGRNAMCLISIMSKGDPRGTEVVFLKKTLRSACLVYVASPADLPTIDLKEIKLPDGKGFYANFVDPDLVGKPVKPGDYKTATPMMIGLGTKYLISVTILCDDLKGADYQEAFKIIQSIHAKEKTPGTEASAAD